MFIIIHRANDIERMKHAGALFPGASRLGAKLPRLEFQDYVLLDIREKSAYIINTPIKSRFPNGIDQPSTATEVTFELLTRITNTINTDEILQNMCIKKIWAQPANGWDGTPG